MVFDTWYQLPWVIQWMVILWLLCPLIFYIILPKLTFLFSKRSKKGKIKHSQRQRQREAIVIVLGDLNHSPRMLNHAYKLLQRGFSVHLSGYLPNPEKKYVEFPEFMKHDENNGDDLLDDLIIDEIEPVATLAAVPFVLFAPYKIIMQCYSLTLLLLDLITDDTKFILIQNPPSIPILLIVSLLKLILFPDIKIIIDWHNLNFTILNLKFNNLNHPFVKLLKKYENFFSLKFSDLNLVVTSKMGDFLQSDFKIPSDKIITLYDKPSDQFRPLINEDEKQQIIKDNTPLVFNDTNFNYNPITDKLIISSTSFTQDEDFSILIDSLIKLDDFVVGKNQNQNQNLFVLITGKGPLQTHYESIISNQDWKFIKIKIVWLPLIEYPRLLRIADLGISLHYSSSGLDLPMKIVDLFGSGIPVISLNFKSIDELVKHKKNGIVLVENNSNLMFQSLLDLMYSDNSDEKLRKLRENAVLTSQLRWNDEWDSKLNHFFKK